MRTIIVCLVLISLINCKQKPIIEEIATVKIDTLQGISLLNKSLVARQVDSDRDSLYLTKYIKDLNDYKKDSLNADNIIWLGRRIGYLSDYKAAITIFGKGIALFPNDARFYRHRGHRYLSTRQFDKAIVDFKKAATLIVDTKDIVEPDGIPNKFNKPISSLHTNIYYHLGVTYYVKNELQNALEAFEKGLIISDNDDKQVSTKHWLYMIYRRLNQEDKATSILEPITKDMNIIENFAYHQLLLLYKGELSEDDLISNNAAGSGEAVQYGLANWYHYNGNIEKATSKYRNLVEKGNWAGFGYIAAEADLSRLLLIISDNKTKN